jgi:hypothetical protein
MIRKLKLVAEVGPYEPIAGKLLWYYKMEIYNFLENFW